MQHSLELVLLILKQHTPQLPKKLREVCNCRICGFSCSLEATASALWNLPPAHADLHHRLTLRCPSYPTPCISCRKICGKQTTHKRQKAMQTWVPSRRSGSRFQRPLRQRSTSRGVCAKTKCRELQGPHANALCKGCVSVSSRKSPQVYRSRILEISNRVTGLPALDDTLHQDPLRTTSARPGAQVNQLELRRAPAEPPV